MNGRLVWKTVLGVLAVIPQTLLACIVILMFVGPGGLNLVPLVRVFIWSVPLVPLLAIYFVWLVSQSDFEPGTRLAWIVALLSAAPIVNIVFWFLVIRKGSHEARGRVAAAEG